MPEPIVRDARASDLETIASFQETMALVTEDRRLDPAKIRGGVRAALDDPNRGFYLVAEIDGEVAGSLFVTFEWSDWRNGFFWWIQSVYVDDRFRRRGVYRALHGAVRARGREAGIVGIRLYVEHENDGAQRTYRAIGMEETPYRMFEE